jgi:serine/threonine protein kinase
MLSLACFLFIFKFRRVYILSKKDSQLKKIQQCLGIFGPLAPRRYRYRELKKITWSFREKIGKGGFGTVYKGALHDGQLVAVKILHNSPSNVEQFLNEVASIGRTSHVNIVSLLGFCFEGSKQALVYEYMPNGSLDTHLYTHDSKVTLGWEKLYDITIGIARGLEYLHQGCNTHIVHFDIKPQNILLDIDFHPKIADFGLAKLCPPKESIISMAEMRGTIGFIAPEVFSRSFGIVSTKSDVYSFGMVLLEIVGRTRILKPSDHNSSQDYFPHWIYQHLLEGGEIQIGDASPVTEEIARKIALVGLWCTQTQPCNRPSMDRVVEMLERNLDELEMPPKPYTDSLPNSTISSVS